MAEWDDHEDVGVSGKVNRDAKWTLQMTSEQNHKETANFM